jgi:hypothetical protein
MTELQEAQLAAAMRGLEFVRKNKDKVDLIPGFAENHQKVINSVQTIFDMLTCEEKDSLLERYKTEMDFLKKQK